jgi:hypothetical protein
VQSYQQRHVGTSERYGRKSGNFAYQHLRYVNGSLTCRKILRHGTSRFTSHQKEGVLRIYIAHKKPSPLPGLNPRPLDPVASKFTTAPPRRLDYDLLCPNLMSDKRQYFVLHMCVIYLSVLRRKCIVYIVTL